MQEHAKRGNFSLRPKLARRRFVLEVSEARSGQKKGRTPVVKRRCVGLSEEEMEMEMENKNEMF